MKLRVHIAGRYRKTDIQAIRAANPSYDELAATKHFVEEKYATWIDKNIKDAMNEYVIDVSTPEYFDITFNHRNEAEQFHTSIGGEYL